MRQGRHEREELNMNTEMRNCIYESHQFGDSGARRRWKDEPD